MTISIFLQFYIICSLITFILKVYEFGIKKIRSEMAEYIYFTTTVDANKAFGMCLLFGPIGMVIILHNLIKFFAFETKESFDMVILDLLIEKQGKEKTRKIFVEFFGELPEHFKKAFN